MELLDKREALKDRLKDTENVRLTQTIGLSGKSGDRKLTSKSHKTEIDCVKSGSDTDHKKPPTLRNNEILENIHRVSQQSSGVNGSLKDSDDEDDAEIVAISNNTGVTPTNYRMEHVDRSLSGGNRGVGQTSGSTLSNARGGSQHGTGESKRESQKVSVTSPLDFIGQILLEWKTVETCKYFKGKSVEIFL